MRQQLEQLSGYLSMVFFGGLLLYAGMVDLDIYLVWKAWAVVGILVFLATLSQPQSSSPFPTDEIWKYTVIPIIVLVTWALISGAWQEEKHFWRKWEVELFGMYLLLPFIALSMWRTPLSAQWLLRIVILVSLYALPYNIALCLTERVRGFGGLSIPIIRGDMAMLIGLLALVSMAAVRGRVWVLLAGIGFVSGVTLSIFSASRGGWIAFITAVPLVWWFIRTRAPKRIYIFWSFIGVLLAVLLICDNPLFDRVVRTFQSLFGYFFEDNHRTSLGWRFVMWKAAWWGFCQQPIVGWGLGNFWDIFQEYIKVSGLEFQEPVRFYRPHNEYLQFLSETGLPGFILYLSVYGMPLWWLWKHKSRILELPLDVQATALILFVTVEAVAEFALSFLGLISVMIGLSYIALVLAAMTVIVRALRS